MHFIVGNINIKIVWIYKLVKFAFLECMYFDLLETYQCPWGSMYQWLPRLPSRKKKLQHMHQSMCTYRSAKSELWASGEKTLTSGGFPKPKVAFVVAALITILLQKFYAVFCFIVLILRGLDTLTTEETVCNILPEEHPGIAPSRGYRFFRFVGSQPHHCKISFILTSEPYNM